ncbi:TB2/DP1, HVA22 family-domain-containing protein [Cytidiella melzeri]|nr:TB2/DP1, HVA22 family-domain-containing protein [Cytidiella melzeri]
MLMSLLSQLVCAWFAFLLPCYSTWKALSHRPTSDPELERWGMYWVCVGGLVAFENVAQWLVSWFPFYWEARTILLLFLALPQIQGSTFVYQTYMQPFFRKNEADIDAAISAAQTNTVAFAQAKLMALWETLWRVATKGNAVAAQSAQGPGGQVPQGQASAPSPASVFTMGQNLLQTYGAGAFGALQRQFAPSQAQPPAASASSVPSRPSPGLQPRPPFYASSSGVSGTSTSSRRPSHSPATSGRPSYSSNTPTTMPEPYHF